jgi:hypothetical protein
MKFENGVIGLAVFSLLLAGLGYALFKLQALENRHHGASPSGVIAAASQGTATPSRDADLSWRYSETPDPMYNSKRVFACVWSGNRVQLAHPNRQVPAELCLRNSPQFDLDVYVQLQHDGQILCGANGCSLRVKFDRHAVRPFPARGAADHSTNIVFVDRRQAQNFVEQLRTSRSAIVEIALFQNGQQELTFNTANLNWK